VRLPGVGPVELEKKQLKYGLIDKVLARRFESDARPPA
jgi:hypothetical protein